MLCNLSIYHFILIDKLEIEFGPGYSVITGETGAGKSIIIGALTSLIGGRMDRTKVKQGEKKCVLEATFTDIGANAGDFFADKDFDFDGDTCIIRREISETGKTRAFINDTPATISNLQDLGKRLIDIHSQHQNLLLQTPSFRSEILDSLSGPSAIDEYKRMWAKFTDKRRELEALRTAVTKKEEEADYTKYAVSQIDAAHLTKNEQNLLEDEQDRLSHSKDISDALAEVLNEIDDANNSIADRLNNAKRSLDSISPYIKKAAEWGGRLESASIEISDIIDDVRSSIDDVTYDPNRLEQIDERLTTIYDLERRYHAASFDELISKYEEMKQSLASSEDDMAELDEMEREYKELEAAITKQAEKLSSERKKAVPTITRSMKTMLKDLGMPDIVFEVKITPLEALGPMGGDNIDFLFSANKEVVPQDIARIASGGEIARIMLCLKAIIAEKQQLPTVIFDEIDTGVSGRIAERMGCTMKSISNNNGTQVISITHLPQIAAKAEKHYMVYKTSTDGSVTTKIKLLSPEERIMEIAKMLSGNQITDAAKNNAIALINN